MSGEWIWTTMKEFDEKDYIEALDYIGIFTSEEK